MIKKMLIISLLFVCLQNVSIYGDVKDVAQIVLNSLTLRQKIAQLLMVAASSHDAKNQSLIAHWKEINNCRIDQKYIEELITHHQIGGIIYYGTNTMAQEQQELTHHFQSLSKIPLFIGLDAETSLSNRLDDQTVTSYPNAMAIAAANDRELTYAIGKELGKQLKYLNVHIAFSPVVDVNSNPANPIIGTRSFGSNCQKVSMHAIAFMNGLQSEGIIACAKHFPGHGDTNADSHEELPQISHPISRLQDIELYPFYQIFNAGVKAVMIAHLEIPALESKTGLPSTLSYAITTDLLQNWMDFKGLIITDALTMKGVTNYTAPGQIEVEALKAGADILLCPVDPIKAINYIERAINEGILSEQDINNKALKVLTAKLENIPSPVTQPCNLKSDYARELQRKAFDASITVISSLNPIFNITKEATKAVLIFKIDDAKTRLESELNKRAIFYKALTFESSAAHVKKTLEEFKDFDHVFITTPTIEELWHAQQNIESNLGLLKEYNKNVHVILFGTPYMAPLFAKADSIIGAYSYAKEAQESIARVIDGSLQPSGILPVEIYFENSN